MQGILGIACVFGVAVALSRNRSHIGWRTIMAGLGIQLGIILLFFKIDWLHHAVLSLQVLVDAVDASARAGAALIFGDLVKDQPFDDANASPIFAFRVLPVILVFAVLVAVLWHWRVLIWVVRGIAFALEKSLGVSGAVGLACGSSLFLGTLEAPLTVRNYLARLSQGELFTVMTCALSTIAGSVLVLYVTLLEASVQAPLGHIVVASLVNVVGAIVLSRMFMPPEHLTSAESASDPGYRNTMDAIASGTHEGVRLVVAVGAMLIVVTALVSLLNMALAGSTAFLPAPLTLEGILGWLFAPLAWLLGVPWEEAHTAGSLFGIKLVLNEFVAYLSLSQLEAEALSERTRIMMVYGLCGFANLASLGIVVSGYGVLVPERRDEVLRLAPLAVGVATLVNCLTAALVGQVLLLV
ncbi:MAG: nucleoside:proton symporter [Gammaproteobacteria bacterium]|nr:nucleoside:proton symporter [Gammaproteobacteria bacterium]MCY4278989.1 nucleoside:proton symporter [Gammaproteobacteria bacterium]